MFRLISALAAIVLSSAATAGDAITIWWAQWAPADGLQQLGDEYAKQTGVKVTVHQIPWGSYQDQVFLDFGNPKTSFDIVVGDSQWLGRGATEKLYLDLSEWLPKAIELKTIHPAALKYLCAYPAGQPRYYAAPCETDAMGFAYRKDWFDDAAERAAFKAKTGRELAVPQTWDEFKQVAEFFHRPADKRYGCAIATGRGYDCLVMGFENFLWDFGGSWGDPATYAVKGHLDSPQAVAGLDFMKSLLASGPKGAAHLDYGDLLEAFTNGSTAMAMNFFAFYPSIAKQMGAKAGFFVMPAKDGRRAIALGGQGMSVSTKVPPAQQELAKSFIAWFGSRAVQEQWITKDAGFTANTEILKSDAFRKATPYNAAFADSLDAVQDFWNAPCYNELLAKAVQRVAEALDGKTTAQEALQALASDHEEILEDAKLKK
jgi:multiple sugar transport system substrate-binding protein